MGKFEVLYKKTLNMFLVGLVWLSMSVQFAYGQESNDAFIQTYCMDCHNSEDWAGSLAMDFLDVNHAGQEPEVWEMAVNKLRGRLMPPAGALQPEQSEVDNVISFLESSIDASAEEHRVIGNVSVQRLNRREFAASVEDLLGVEVDEAQLLPGDIEVEGFDNIANALSASPSFLEQYIAATRTVATQAVGSPIPKFANVFYSVPGRGFNAGSEHKDGFPLGTRGGMKFTHFFPADGEYRFNVLDIDAGLYPRGMETASTMVILIDGVEMRRLDIGGPEDLALADKLGVVGGDIILDKIAGLSADVEVGFHEVTFTFIERSWALSNDQSGGGKVTGVPKIGLGIEVEGPYDPRELSLSESRSKIFVCQPSELAEEQACAENIAQNLATKAFRRPVTDEDLEWLMPFYEMGRAEEGGFDAGVTELITAVLSSPDFLYRSMLTEPDQPRQLDDLELAARLSYFLWGQGPDEELITLASEGQLSDQAVLDRQVIRMLDDHRAQSLVENFALAWLNLDELEAIEPADISFTDDMRTNFETEIRLFLSSVLLEDRSVHELLTADWTYLNDSLARHYDIAGVLGPQFRKVTLTNEYRFGLLGKGATLLRTSYGDRTSPVLRGAWVLERIMGTPPAPPPPNVETDLSVREGEVATTIRARLEEHRENPTCMGCHGLIDPPGLALENFDVTGRWREIDRAANAPIDASTVLTSGLEIEGPIELRNFLLSKEDQLPTTVTKRLMMYALNREIEYFDMPQVREIVRDSANQNYTFASIVKGIVNSDAFRMQGPEHETELTTVASVQTSFENIE